MIVLLKEAEIHIMPFMMHLFAYCLPAGISLPAEQLEIATLVFHQMIEKIVSVNSA